MSGQQIERYIETVCVRHGLYTVRFWYWFGYICCFNDFVIRFVYSVAHFIFGCLRRWAGRLVLQLNESQHY